MPSNVPAERDGHPVDLVEHVASLHEWAFERAGEDEISISLAGRDCDYALSFTWLDDMEALHLACSFEAKIPKRRLVDLAKLVGLVNEQLWVGHFDLWGQEGAVMFRHSLVLAGGASVNSEQCEALIKIALATCEKYFQAFHFVIWAGKGPKEALDMVMFETQGEA